MRPLGAPGDNLRPLKSNFLWIALVVFALPLFLAVDYGIKILTSVYKKELGNGVVIYADDYVKSGLWVFDCKYSRVISRERLPAPLVELAALENIRFGEMYYLDRSDLALAKDAIIATTALPGWYDGLRYVYSGLSESSRLSSHKFFVLADYAGVRWAIDVDQSLGLSGGLRFVLSARPYDSETYVDYEKAFEAAVKSCPAPQ